MLILALQSCGGGTQGSGVDNGIYTRLAGTVRDSKGNPVKDAEVTEVESGERVLSDTNGAFVIEFGREGSSIGLEFVINSGPPASVALDNVPETASDINLKLIADTRNNSVIIDEVSYKDRITATPRPSASSTAASHPQNTAAPTGAPHPTKVPTVEQTPTPRPTPTQAEATPTPQSYIGDVNHSGCVDNQDISIVTANFNKSPATYEEGDITGEDIVDDFDLDVVITNFGHGNRC